MSDGAGYGGAPLPDVVLLDDALVARERAVISAFDRGVLYGESLFETLKVVEGAVCLWEPHAARLVRGCEELGLPVDPERLSAGVARLLEARPVEHGVLRVQVTGGVQPGGGRGLTASAGGRMPRITATVTESPPMTPAFYERGVDVVAAAGFGRAAPRLKSGNYLPSIRAKAHAEAAGAFECLLVAGEPPCLLEGSFSNVLLWDGEGLVCPPEGDRLPGVTLGALLEVASSLGMRVVHREVGLAEARTAGLLLTGSLLGVCACSHLDGGRLADARSVAGTLRRGLEEREALSRAHWRSVWTATT